MTKCHDCELPSEPEYDMDFTDVPNGKVLHFCAEHGHTAHLISKNIIQACKNDPAFAKKLDKKITKAERKIN